MSGFNLSPGITPFITEMAIIGFALTFGLTAIYSKAPSKAFYLAVGLNALALSVFKIYTDYFDFWDAFLGLIIATEAIVLIVGRLRVPSNWNRGARLIATILVAIVISLSVYKILSDFYDPYDVLLSCLGILGGAAITEFGNRATVFGS